MGFFDSISPESMLGDMIMPGLGMVTGVIGGIQQQKASAREAQRARDWSEDMASTAHEREVVDLRRAGLNPILSATKGLSGAPVPGAAVASQNDVVSTGLNSAIAMYNAGYDARLKRSTEFKQGAESARIKEETLNLKEERNRIEADIMKMQQDIMTSSALELKYKGELPVQQATVANIQADTAVKATTAALNKSTVSLQEVTKEMQKTVAALNKQSTKSEFQRTKELTHYVDVVSSHAAAAKVEQRIDESTYGKVLRYLNRLIPGAKGAADIVRANRKPTYNSTYNINSARTLSSH